MQIQDLTVCITSRGISLATLPGVTSSERDETVAGTNTSVHKPRSKMTNSTTRDGKEHAAVWDKT